MARFPSKVRRAVRAALRYTRGGNGCPQCDRYYALATGNNSPRVVRRAACPLHPDTRHRPP